MALQQLTLLPNVTEMADDIEEFMKTGLPRVDPKTGCLHFSNGRTIKTKEIPSLRLMRVYGDRTGEPVEPTPPLKPMTYGGNITRDEPDPTDPEYVELHDRWEEAHSAWALGKNQRLIMFVLLSGIDEPVPPGFEEEVETFTPGASKASIRFDYYCTLIPNEEVDWAVEALVGRTLATDKGVEEADKFLPSTGQST